MKEIIINAVIWILVIFCVSLAIYILFFRGG